MVSCTNRNIYLLTGKCVHSSINKPITDKKDHKSVCSNGGTRNYISKEISFTFTYISLAWHTYIQTDKANTRGDASTFFGVNAINIEEEKMCIRASNNLLHTFLRHITIRNLKLSLYKVCRLLISHPCIIDLCSYKKQK